MLRKLKDRFLVFLSAFVKATQVGVTKNINFLIPTLKPDHQSNAWSAMCMPLSYPFPSKVMTWNVKAIKNENGHVKTFSHFILKKRCAYTAFQVLALYKKIILWATASLLLITWTFAYSLCPKINIAALSSIINNLIVTNIANFL